MFFPGGAGAGRRVNSGARRLNHAKAFCLMSMDSQFATKDDVAALEKKLTIRMDHFDARMDLIESRIIEKIDAAERFHHEEAKREFEFEGKIHRLKLYLILALQVATLAKAFFP
jgi:hypothetical protein